MKLDLFKERDFAVWCLPLGLAIGLILLLFVTIRITLENEPALDLISVFSPSVNQAEESSIGKLPAYAELSYLMKERRARIKLYTAMGINAFACMIALVCCGFVLLRAGVASHKTVRIATWVVIGSATIILIYRGPKERAFVLPTQVFNEVYGEICLQKEVQVSFSPVIYELEWVGRYYRNHIAKLHMVDYLALFVLALSASCFMKDNDQQAVQLDSLLHRARLLEMLLCACSALLISSVYLMMQNHEWIIAFAGFSEPVRSLFDAVSLRSSIFYVGTIMVIFLPVLLHLYGRVCQKWNQDFSADQVTGKMEVFGLFRTPLDTAKHIFTFFGPVIIWMAGQLSL